MGDWKHGYYAESGYTFGYYAETAPLRLAWVAGMRGHGAPTRGFRYLDLGCGQGFGLNLLAACHPDAEFVGVDFLPEHVAHARSLARRGGLNNVTVIEGDFVALTQQPESLGPIDYASAHGISTWIDPSVRQAMFALVERVLQPGGLLYNSYNTYPGWLPTTPLQHLIMLEQRHHDGPTALRRAREHMLQLLDGEAGLFNSLPGLKSRVRTLEQLDTSYLVQEYNNAHWQPMFVADMMRALSEHKLTYVGTATLAECFDHLLPRSVQDLLNAQSADPLIRETLRDFALAQSFRRDIYGKGRQTLWPGEQQAQMADVAVIANPLSRRPDAEEGFAIKSGTLSFKADFAAYSAVLDAAVKPTTLARLVADGHCANLQLAVQSVSMLMHGGWLGLAQKVDCAPARRFNQAVLEAVGQGAPYRYLAAPRLGTAIALDSIELLMLAARAEGCADNALVDDVDRRLQQLGHSLQEQGKPLTDRARIRDKLAEICSRTLERVAHLESLGVL